jgi:hypothetical protein
MASARSDSSERTIAESVASDKSGKLDNPNNSENKPEDEKSTDKKPQDDKPKEGTDDPSITRAMSLTEVTTNATHDANDVEANIQKTITTKLFPVTNLDEGIIGWDSQDDPENPQNFAMGQKWGLLALMSAITFISPLASSTFSPAVSYIAADLHETNETVLSFSVSIFLLGYAVSWPMRIFSSVCRFFVCCL